MRFVFVIPFISMMLMLTVDVQAASIQRCDNANWWVSLDRTRWSVCPRTNTYLRGFWRSPKSPGDERVGRLEEGRCCDAVDPHYAGQPATCSNADWSRTLDGFNVWALCPNGYYMNGLRLGYAPPAFLFNIDEAKCCHPQNHSSSYGECYDEDVSISFDARGWSECQREGYYMAGFYKSNCNDLGCIEKFRCCKMKNATTDDGWTDWGDWGECSAACGDGEQERMRNCSIPHSSITGAQCLGPNKETRRCNNGPCKVKFLDCDKADWQVSLDRTGWSVCPRSNTYLKGLWRHDPRRGDNRVGRIEYGRCCATDEPSYANQPSTCLNADWARTLDEFNVWALCPNGYYMNGLRLGYAPPAFLFNIDEAQCCHPQNHPSSYEDCYDEDVTISFDFRGWSECQLEGYYMAGFYKSSCNKLNCIEKFRCCKMTNATAINGRWSDWGDWGECNAACGDGEQERMRTCSNPPPSNATARCSGLNKETRPCNNGPCEESVCSDGWVHFGNSCFLVIDIPTMEWKDARRNCQKLGGDLAKITSATQNQFILDLLRKQAKFTLYGAWLGLHRKADNKFYWADDTPLTGYNVWNIGEPNNADEKCGHLTGKYGKWNFTPAKWNDVPCILPGEVIQYNEAPVVLCQKIPNEMEVLSHL